MFKKSIITLLLLIVFGFNAYAQDKCNTYSEPSIGVTFCAPQKWTIRKREDNPYAKIFGETSNGLTPNINLQTGSFTDSLSKVTDSGVENVLKTKGTDGISKVELKSKSEFAADTQGFKVVYHIEVDGLNLRTIQYFFKGLGDTKIVVTATLPMSDADALEGIVDASLKTFKVTSKPVKIGTNKVSSVSKTFFLKQQDHS